MTMTVAMIVWMLMMMTVSAVILVLIRKLQKQNEARATEIANLAIQVASLKTDNFEHIEEQIEEKKDEIFSEWIQNIANYNPFGGT